MAKNKLNKYIRGKGVVSIKVAPNQKVVEIHKAKEKSIINIKYNRAAQANLSLAAYAMYMHLMSNLHGYQEVLSVENIIKTTALSEKTYYKAIKELIEKGYLIKTQNKDIANYYTLYEDPSLVEISFDSDSSEDEI